MLLLTTRPLAERYIAASTLAAPLLPRPRPAASAVAEVADRLAGAERPLILAGRGAVLAGAGGALERGGDAVGALLATSAGAKWPLSRSPWDLRISGGLPPPPGSGVSAPAGLGAALRAPLIA